MKKEYFDNIVDSLRAENSRYKKIIIGVLISNVLLVGLVYKTITLEKVIVTPNNSPDNSYWIKSDMISTNYMEAFARDVISLNLNVSPETVNGQYDAFLKLVSPELRSYIVDDLKQSADDIIKNNISKVYYIDAIKAVTNERTIYVGGNLYTYVNNQLISNTEQVYKIVFDSDNLTVKVAQFRLLDPTKDALDIKKACI